MSSKGSVQTSQIRFWIVLVAVVLVGMNLDRVIGLSWFEGLYRVLGISPLALGVCIFIAILSIIAVSMWMPRRTD